MQDHELVERPGKGWTPSKEGPGQSDIEKVWWAARVLHFAKLNVSCWFDGSDLVGIEHWPIAGRSGACGSSRPTESPCPRSTAWSESVKSRRPWTATASRPSSGCWPPWSAAGGARTRETLPRCRRAASEKHAGEALAESQTRLCSGHSFAPIGRYGTSHEHSIETGNCCLPIGRWVQR